MNDRVFIGSLAIVCAIVGFLWPNPNRLDFERDLTSTSGCSGSGKPAVGNIDAISIDGRQFSPTDTIVVANPKLLKIEGWAIAGDRSRPVRSVCLLVDNAEETHAVATYGVARPDVARALNGRSLVPSGFSIDVPASFVLGRHSIAIGAATADGPQKLPATVHIDLR